MKRGLRAWYQVLAVVALALCTLAAFAQPERQDLFIAGQGGYHTYRIPALIATSQGTLLAFCEGRKHSRSDTGDIDLLLKRSTDGGRTWSQAQVIWDDGPNTCGNPCPVVDQTTGVIWLLLTHNPGDSKEDQIIGKKATGTRTVWLSKSDDDGKNWSPPTNITAWAKDPAWGWYATGPGVGIQIQHGPHRGRLVIPCDHSYDDPNHTPARPHGSHVIYSDDHGRTWQRGGLARPNMDECQVAELAEAKGSLLLNMRTTQDTHRAQSLSSDGGQTWTPPEPQAQLVEPRCQASLLRYNWPNSKEPGRLLFSNPAGVRRTNLTIRVSLDDGKTWPIAKSLHAGPAAYSCLAVLADQSIGCLYECGETNAYQRITFARFPLAWLEPANLDDAGWQDLRAQARNRRRRLIFNNDGNEPVYFCQATTAEDLLKSRTAPLAGSQVDSIFYCTWSSGFGLFTHHTKVGQLFSTREAMFKDNRTQDFLDRGIDPLQVMVDFGHQHQIEVFWSLRLNDTHDASRANYGPVMFRANHLKQQHPEWLIASKEHPPKYGAWSAMDFALPEVRELAFRYCEEVCTNYDVDGLELDFFRHAFFFKCSATGAAAGDRELDQMTSLVRRIRARAEELGRKRRRPILLAIRVPDSVEYGRFLGVDLENWLANGLVDLLVVGGYTRLNPWDYSVRLGHKYGVKVYPSLDESRVRDPAARELRNSLATYRGRALDAWSAGSDGVYLFNFFDPHSPLWRQLGDPANLRGLPRNYFASVRGVGAMPVPHQQFLHVPVLNPANPVRLPPGESVRVEVAIGEQLASATPQPPRKLRLKLSQPVAASGLRCNFNGVSLADGRLRDGWLEFDLADKALRKGTNTFQIAAPALATTALSLLDLYVAIGPE